MFKLVYSILIVSLLVGGCRKYSKQPVFVDSRVLTDVTTPITPQNEKERLVATAITRAVIDERDIPLYDWLPDKEKIVVVNAIGMDDKFHADEFFTAGALPNSETVGFILLTPKQIKQRIIHIGRFYFIHVTELNISDSIGSISIAIKEANDEWNLETGWIGCYSLEYVKSKDKWKFSKITDSYGFGP